MLGAAVALIRARLDLRAGLCVRQEDQIYNLHSWVHSHIRNRIQLRLMCVTSSPNIVGVFYGSCLSAFRSNKNRFCVYRIE
jgi:hypothetical protein